jgi:hypothetical protein
LVTGESGSGKSALLANWWKSVSPSFPSSGTSLNMISNKIYLSISLVRKKNASMFCSQCSLTLFFICTGSSFMASDFPSMLIHLFEEINNTASYNGTEALQIPNGKRELIEAFPQYLDLASLQVSKKHCCYLYLFMHMYSLLYFLFLHLFRVD